MSEVSTQSKIDMGQVNPAESTSLNYLEPGIYRLKIDTENVKLETPSGKTPYLSVRYLDEKDGTVVEKFYLTPKAIERLQYYYMAITGKKLDKVFSSYIEIGKYFEQLFKSKPLTRAMKTGGTLNPDGKFYSGLPYTNFIIPENVDVEIGSFEKNSANWKSVVNIKKTNPAVSGTDSTIIPDSNGGYVPIDETPW